MGLLALLVASLLAAPGCGAKTGLEAPDVFVPPDVGPDVPPDVRAPQCFPQRVHTQVGFATNLRPDATVHPASGYVWTLRGAPEGSRARLFSDGTDVANLTPDRAGEYDVLVEVPAEGVDGGRLACPIVLIARPPDPRCPGYALVEPRVVAIPGGDMQVAFDTVWGPVRTTAGPDAGALVADDPTARVAVGVLQRPARVAPPDPGAEAQSNEEALARALGATAVFVGRTGQTDEGFPVRRSTLRLGTTTVSTPGALRDEALRALAGLEPPAEPGPPHAQAAAFYLELTTVVRPDTGRVTVIVAVSPVAAFDDNAGPTAIRVNDMANASALARVDRTLDVTCHEVRATRVIAADFLWLVDTSASMNDDQQRVGDTAQRFFQDLAAAGVDFRVGVMQAGSRGVDLTRNGGFRWISGDDPNGARTMAFQVTRQAYRGDRNDRQEPFEVRGFGEEPIAAAVLAIREFERRRAAGETNPHFVLRPDAARVVFFVTDEPGSNDLERFFSGQPEWGTNLAMRTARIAQFFTTRAVLPFGLVPSFSGVRCPNEQKLAACVINAAGGAFIPIDVRSDAEVNAAFAAAMNRVVDAVAGAASEFVLPAARSPVSSTLRARVDGRIAPRSRVDGFDYDDRTRALIFRGPTFRPRPGQQVRVAYFFWQDTR